MEFCYKKFTILSTKLGKLFTRKKRKKFPKVDRALAGIGSLIILLIILLERLLESMILCGSARRSGQSHVALITQLTS